MSLFASRLVFVAFIGLCGLITYNALYLQDVRGGAGRQSADNEQGLTDNKPSDESEVAKTTKTPDMAVDSTVTGAAPSTGAASSNAPVQEASSALVTAVQRELSVRGYDVGDGDGAMTQETADAIRSYERAHGLEETGSPSDDLLRHIVLGESLEDMGMATPNSGQGSAPGEAPGDMVRAVQQTLADLGYAPGPVDGMMGQNTADAIRAFQKDRQLAETGEITPTLLQEMERVSGRRFAGGSTYQ
ncbi:MAG: peptidoglycan-binding domain-containing protein [Methyloligella sp. ZOD6]